MLPDATLLCYTASVLCIGLALLCASLLRRGWIRSDARGLVAGISAFNCIIAVAMLILAARTAETSAELRSLDNARIAAPARELPEDSANRHRIIDELGLQ